MALPAAVRMTVALTLDGTPVPGFPVERRPTGASYEHLDLLRAAAGVGVLTSELVPLTTVPVSVLLLETTQPLRVALNAQDQDGVTDLGFAAGGVLLIAQANVTAVATANPTATAAPYSVLALTA